MFRLFYIALFPFFLLGCQLLRQPPYILKKQTLLSNDCINVKFLDVDQDGVDEIFILDIPKKKAVFAAKIRMFDYTGLNIRQEFPLHTSKVTFDVCDLDNEGSPYLIITRIEGNRSLVQLIDLKSNQSQVLQLSQGKDSFKTGFGWDGSLSIDGFVDLNHDGAKDALISIDVNYDQGERGLAAVDIRHGKLLWKFICGSRILFSEANDMDGDGHLELFLHSKSPQNGLKINGIEDSTPYFLVLNEQGKLIKKQPIPLPGGIVKVHLFDIDKDGKKEIVRVIYGSFVHAQSHSCLQILNWPGNDILNEIELPGGVSEYAFLDGDKYSTMYFTYIPWSNKKIIRIYNDQLQLIRTIHKKQKFLLIEQIFDVDGDFKNDILLRPFISSRSEICDQMFRPIAFVDSLGKIYRYNFFSQANYRLLVRKNNSQLWIVSLKYNWGRFKWLAIGIGFCLPWMFMLVLFLALKHYRQNSDLFVQPYYLDHLNTGIIFISPNNRIIYLNHKAQQLLQIKIPSPPILLKMFVEHLPDDLGNRIKQYHSDGFSTSFEFSFGMGSNLRHLLFNMVSVMDSKNRRRGTLVTIEDLTSVVRSQRSIAFASLTQYLAHDIKNPLSNVRLILERMKLESNAFPAKYRNKLATYLKSIEKDINLVRNVTDSFMQFSNLSKPNFEKTEIHPLIDLVISKRLPLIKDRIEIKKKFININIVLNIDKDQSSRALDNILDNSIRAINNRGVILISTKISERIDEQTGLTHAFFEIEIEDTGKGIEADLLDKVFEPFVSNAKGGTGLGLAIVKKIVEDHKGEVSISSNPDIGTRVWLCLPMEEEQE